jgi:hypothetical protein
MQEQITRMDKRLARMEQMLREALSQTAAAPPAKMLNEREVMATYGISKVVLQRLRLGYKRNDGVAVPPMLFKWGHLNGRAFMYDAQELAKIFESKT